MIKFVVTFVIFCRFLSLQFRLTFSWYCTAKTSWSF